MIDACTRRSSLKTTVIAGTVASLAGLASAAPGKTVKVALVGCGGRGKGDLNNFLKACKILNLDAEVVALADAFESAAVDYGQKFNVPAENCFGGFDAYRKVAQSDAEYVLLVTPPLFRPLHLEAMVNAGKNVFVEKPVAVDAPGCRKVIALGELAKKKGLGVSAGMQRRHSGSYLKNKALVDAGAIGEILGGIVTWNGRVPWIKERRPEDSDAQYLARNWLNWTEMSGDHICEQHVHNLDVANWFIGHPPASAVGFGGRARRETGNSFDFFSVDLDYGDNVHIHSQCRQISGCYNRVGEELRGTKGVVFGGGKLKGDPAITVPDPKMDTDNEGVQEFIDMIRGVRSGQPLNEAQIVAEATATAIMGRIACYTGKMVRWSDLMQNEKSEWYNFTCGIVAEDFETGSVKLPPEDVVAIPGDGAPIKRRN
ncbi:Gfo/Idh/MocA family protein [Pontiella sulfatireligans]|uniref:Scyllo-inositol 2-dehydrogenase (NADP(+)) n=1 Tax=Pontiella sulfatireligans TaxID=2750658 RepID=A0A6C2UTN5_9BACT|nr:Gfo/Idh/MocA family oxidoreductase [Pontiella sulfatireligans]VGO22276.1 scyllo-inositol 2-dehydrogenase (NADP(+)) [Pontiella sulfatireligans]